MSDERDFEQLQALRDHRVKTAVAPDEPVIARKIYEYRYQDSLLGPCVRLSFHPMREKWRLEGVQYLDLALESGRLGLSERTWNNENSLTDDTIALLQKARALMGGV